MNIDDAIAHEEQGLAMYMEFANTQNPVFSEILSVKPMGVNILKQSKQVENSKEDDKINLKIILFLIFHISMMKKMLFILLYHMKLNRRAYM